MPVAIVGSKTKELSKKPDRRFSIKAERERQNFIAVAQKEFLLRGFEKTTIKDLTDQLNLTKGAFFYYFKSKEEILVAVCQNLIEGQVEKLGKICKEYDKSVEWRIKSLFNVLYGTFCENKELWRHVIHDTSLHKQTLTTARAEITPFIIELLKEGSSKGVFNVPYPEEVAETMLMIVDLYVVQYSSTMNKLRQERAFGAMEYALGLILGENCKPIFSAEKSTDGINR